MATSVRRISISESLGPLQPPSGAKNELLINTMGRAAIACLALLGAAAPAAALSKEDLTVGLLKNVAGSAARQLLSYYNKQTGWFGSAGVPFWTTANAVETLANYMNLTGDASPLATLDDCHRQAFRRYCDCWRYVAS